MLSNYNDINYINFNQMSQNSSNLMCSVFENDKGSNLWLPKTDIIVSPEEIAQDMHFKASNLGYGLGSILGRLAEAITEKAKSTLPVFKNSMKNAESKGIQNAKLMESDIPSSSITTYFGEGHASIKLECLSCTPDGEPVSQSYSFYPKVSNPIYSYCPQIDDSDPVIVFNSFVGTKGIALPEDALRCAKDTQYKQYSITESQASRVYEFVTAPHNYHFFGVRGYNCLDFTQKAFEMAGFNKHFFTDLTLNFEPNFWGTFPPLYLFVYSKIYPLHPIMTLAVIVTPILSMQLCRKLKQFIQSYDALFNALQRAYEPE